MGEPGNLVLAGHRTSWFKPLEEIKPGDTIQIEWFDTRRARLLQRTYVVSAIRIVEPEEATLLGPTPDDALTLVTCYPFGRAPNSPQRCIVRALPLGRSIQI
jgi:sortase A